jgi:hypothetical protein
MKTEIPLAVILVTSCLTSYGQITLQPGDAYVFEFSSLPSVGPPPRGDHNQGRFDVFIAPDTIQSGDILMIDLFENTPLEMPFASGEFSLFGKPATFGILRLDAWQDLQGSGRVTMLSGSCVIDRFRVSSVRLEDGVPIQYASTIVPTPEPGTLSLIVIGVLGGIYAAKRKSKAVSNQCI